MKARTIAGMIAVLLLGVVVGLLYATFLYRDAATKADVEELSDRIDKVAFMAINSRQEEPSAYLTPLPFCQDLVRDPYNPYPWVVDEVKDGKIKLLGAFSSRATLSAGQLKVVYDRELGLEVPPKKGMGLKFDDCNGGQVVAFLWNYCYHQRNDAAWTQVVAERISEAGLSDPCKKK